MHEPPVDADLQEKRPEDDAATDQATEAAATSLTRAATLVPGWLVNLAELGWRVLAIAALVLVLWFVGTTLWTVTASIAVAIIVSAVLAPFVLRLRDQGRSRTAAAGIVWTVALLAITGVILLLALAFLPYVAELARSIDAGISEFQAQLADLQVPAWVGALAQDAITAVRSTAEDAGGGILAAAAGAVTVAILASFLVFFFLRDGDKAWLWLFQAVSDEKRELVTSAGDTALARVGGYLRGTTVLSGLIAITDYVFMLLLGVPLALPLAVLVFMAGYIPYFGGIVTTAIILIVTLGALGAGPFVVMLVLMGIRSVVLGYLVRPAVYGRTVRIHPAFVLVVLPAGYQLAGIIGLFVAVPVTAVILAVAGATIAIMEPVPAPPLPSLVPAWLDRAAQSSWRILVVIALIALLVGILVTVPLVVIPVILATILAATLEPLVQSLMRRGNSRARSAAIAVGGGSVAVGAILALTIGSLFSQAEALAGTVISGAGSANDSLGGQLGVPAEAVANGAREVVRTIATLGDDMAAMVTVVVLGSLLTFYLLRDGGHLWGRLVSRLRTTVAGEIDAAGTRAFEVLGGYMVGTAVISFVGAASQLVIMVVLGIPLALPVFVLSFFLAFIPYIGGFISTGIAFLITVAVGSPTDVLVMGIWTIVFNIVTGNIVSPIVYGRTVHIHPAIVLLAIPAGFAVAGVLGMFVVVPALGVVATTWRTVLSAIGSGALPAGPEPAPVADLATADPG